MTWHLDDFLKQPERLKKKLQIHIRGAPKNNSPRNEQITIANDAYEIVYFGRDAIGTAEVPASFVPDQLVVNGTWGAGGNAYLLPWQPNALCLAELGQQHDFFFTSTLTGCAVMVSGGRCNPLVIHANTQSNQLNEMAGEQRIAMFRRIYQAIGARLGTGGTMDEANLAVFKPGDYLQGAVFGVRTAGCWAFYANSWGAKGAVTTKIWPVR